MIKDQTLPQELFARIVELSCELILFVSQESHEKVTVIEEEDMIRGMSCGNLAHWAPLISDVDV
jgi:hypothetical protein